VAIKFIVDINAGKLAKWLRIMGYDTLLFMDKDDGQMVKIALRDSRIILTKDSQFLKRRIITSGKIRAMLVEGEDSKGQLKQVTEAFKLDYQHKPFSLCLECNSPLVEKGREEVKDTVPPHIFKTHDRYMECPLCHRIYWQGTHWQAMNQELERFTAKK
jgi:uncharacterized protein with PIN domain